MDINKVLIKGEIIEITAGATKGGYKFTNVVVLTRKVIKDKDPKETIIPVTLWGKAAESFSCVVGDIVSMEGNINSSEKDSRNGKFYSLSVYVWKVTKENNSKPVQGKITDDDINF